MAYPRLYDHCQGLTIPPHVGRKVIYEKVLALRGVNRIRHFRAALDTTVTRGFYLSAKNTEHPYVKQAGGRVIVTARGLDPAWERFVFIKELMHSFDDPNEATDTGDNFDAMLDQLTGPTGTPTTPQGESEYKCFWMALACFCPEPLRLQLIERKNLQQVDDYAIALQLRIPQDYVGRLFEARFQTNITRLLAKAA